MNIDIEKYIEKKGFLNIDRFLRDNGYERKEEFLSVRIDTVAAAQILGCTTKTLNSYIKRGVVKVDDRRRMSVYYVLDLKKRNLRREAKQLEAFNPGKRRL